MAFRNALAVAVPLGAGIAMGNALAGVAIATGALNVSYADGKDPYNERARRMLLWSVLSAIAVFAGSITGNSYLGAVAMAAVWGFAAGMLMGAGTHAGDLGLNTLVSVIVFSARGVSTPEGAFYSGLLALGGGVLQTLFAVFLWPVRRDKPEREAVGAAYKELAKEVDPHYDGAAITVNKARSVEEQDTLSALGRDHSVQGERYRLLFDQADRLRLSIYLVSRLRDGLGEGDSQNSETESDAAEMLDRLLVNCATLLYAVGDCLNSQVPNTAFDTLLAALDGMAEEAQRRKQTPRLAAGRENCQRGGRVGGAVAAGCATDYEHDRERRAGLCFADGGDAVEAAGQQLVGCHASQPGLAIADIPSRSAAKRLYSTG